MKSPYFSVKKANAKNTENGFMCQGRGLTPREKGGIYFLAD
jgi:hypothetical protein